MHFLLICLVGLLVSVQASPVSPPMIAGQVRLAVGSPVAGAQVALFDLADLRRGPVGHATTDEEGQFALPRPTAGRALVLPQEIALGANYPNPFNPSTLIPYQLPAPSLVRLEVFNILGQRVATLVDGEQEAGVYRAHWDGTDAAGRAAAAGVYFYRLTVAGAHWTGKMVLVDGQAGVPLAGGARVEAVKAEAGAPGRYGLVVSGAGLAAYVDSDFDGAAGMGSVVLDRAMRPHRAGKVVVPLEGMLGDVNADGRVDLDDGLLVAMYRVDPSLSLPNHGAIGLGDVNCNGRVEFADAGLIGTFVANPSDASVSSRRIGQRSGYSLDPVMEVVWGSILGNEQQDPTVAQLLNEVPVLISGVKPDADGQDHISLGIGRAYWAQHGGKHIYQALKQRFPVTPIHVKPSSGVNRQSFGSSGLPSTAIRTVKPVTLFGDPISFSQAIGTAIADNGKTQTVVGRIEVPDDVRVGTVSVGVEIIHPSPGDLKIDLVAPSGVATTLYDGVQAGFFPAAAANLIEVLPATTALQGQAAQGVWQLRVGDYERADAGMFQAWELTITPAQDVPETENPVSLFLETFQEGLDAWSGPKWEATAFDGVPDEGPGNVVARTQGGKCGICFLTLTPPIDLSAHEEVILSFDRYLSHGMGSSEFFGIDVGNNGSYHRLKNWSGQDADSEWRRETFTLSGNHIGDAFSIRFFGVTTNDFTNIAIDNVMITAAAGSVIVEPVPESEPTETPADLSVTALTARPTVVMPGRRVLLRATAANTDAPTAAYRVSFYRHDQATDNPTQGGVPLTSRTVTMETDTTRTISIVTTVQTVPGTYHYSACIQELSEEDTDNNCASTTVTVQGEETTEPEIPEPVEDPGETPTSSESENGTPSFTISDVGATPPIVFENEPVTITATITNTGTAAGEATISFYYTITPVTDADLLGKRFKEPNTKVLTLEPNQSATITSTHIAPTGVSDRSLVRYYACIDTSCSEPIRVDIQKKYPGPPYVSCNHVPERINPMGGDSLSAIRGDAQYLYCVGTITLGGVEDIDGVRGFIAAGHSLNESQIGSVVAHSLWFGRPKNLLGLGTVFKLPSFYDDENNKRILSTDSAFVAYPKDTATDTYLEQLEPLKVRGAGDAVYTVIGSKTPVKGESLWVFGSVTGQPVKLTAIGIVLASGYVPGWGNFYSYEYLSSPSPGSDTTRGDSGGPVYTEPDTNGNVYITGVHTGSSPGGELQHSLWESVEDEFGLKPIEK